MNPRRLAAALAVAAGLVALPAPARAATVPIYGDTLDNAAYGNYTKVVNGSQQALNGGRRLTHRIVFDRTATLTDYGPAVQALAPVSDLLATPVDSSEMKNYSTTAYAQRFDTLIGMYPQFAMWEVGNEINGEWLGTGAAANAYAGWQHAAAAGKVTELTPFYEPDCGSNPANEMFTWLQNQIVTPHPDMAAGLSYVMVSYYETTCNGHRPGQAEFDSIFSRLHGMFPNARLGWGEVGLTRRVGSGTLAQAKDMLTYYYGLKPTDPGVAAVYDTGGFWWYGQEDLYPTSTSGLWPTFWTAISRY